MPILISDKYDAWKVKAAACFDQLKVSGEEINPAFTEPGLRVLSCDEFSDAAITAASGCPCFVLRAAPFMFLLTASKLALAIRLRFGARTPCCGHGLDHLRRQSRRQGGKLRQLNNQVHGRIATFRKRRSCQHRGLALPIS